MTQRLLFISAYLPSNAVPAGGNRLSATGLLAKCREYKTVDVVSFRNDISGPYNLTPDEYSNVNSIVYDITLKSRLFSAILYPLLPFGASVRRYLALNAVRRLLKSNRYDEIYVDFVQGLGALPEAELHRTTLKAHDVTYQLYLRQLEAAKGLAKLIPMIEYYRSFKLERAVFPKVRELIVISQKDADLVQGMCGRHPTVVPPTGFYQSEGRAGSNKDPNQILFWGNMSRPENQQGILFFVDQVLPLILERRPKARLTIAGASPPPAIVNLQNSSIEVTGYVDSPDALFNGCGIGIAPLVGGAGVKIKVLEMLASGVPVVATSVGSEGIEPTENLTTTDDPRQFAQACVSILEKLEADSNVQI